MAVDVLMSFALWARADLAEVKAALGPRQYLMIDSGAFTAHTTGKQVRREDYLAFLKHWEGVWDYAMNLDVIGDAHASERNLRWLRERGAQVMPIYTAKAPLGLVDDLAQRGPYMAYGGLVGSPRNLQIPAVKTVVDRAAKYGCRVHVLGMTSATMFAKTRAYSGDSSAVSRAPLQFQVPIFDPGVHRLVPLKFGERSGWQQRRRLLRAYGLDAAACISGDVVRHKDARIPMFRAGCLSVAALAASLRNGGGQPRIYSSVGQQEVLTGAMQAAADWRTGNLPHPLNTLTKELP